MHRFLASDRAANPGAWLHACVARTMPVREGKGVLLCFRVFVRNFTASNSLSGSHHNVRRVTSLVRPQARCANDHVEESEGLGRHGFALHLLGNQSQDFT